MSMGGGDSAVLDDAVNNAIAQGVTFVVAAGNDNADACSGSPNKVPAAITVGASTNADSRDTSYSNYGSCVDLFAPGTNITSAWNTSSRSEEHTSELQSLMRTSYAVFCLKKQKTNHGHKY